jgi:hypothetical protein
MDMRKYKGSTFITLDDVKDGPMVQRIAGCVDGKYDKANLIFESGDRLGLNKTNVKTLCKALGTNSEDWPGVDVKIYAGEVETNEGWKPATLVEVLESDVKETAPKIDPTKIDPDNLPKFGEPDELSFRR